MEEVKVPSPGESISEVDIASWTVTDGDYVEIDDVIAEIDSDKATLELTATASGTISLKAEEGDTVEVGQIVAEIDTSAESPAGSPAPKEEKKEAATAPAPKEETPKASAAPESTSHAAGSSFTFSEKSDG